jgi:hypothetical protein
MKSSLPAWVVKVVHDVTHKNAYVPMVSVEELEPKYEMAWSHLQSLGVKPGDYLEFGVSVGTSMACMHSVVTKLGLNDVRLFGFDSFKGMPESAAVEDRGTWKPGEFASPLRRTKAFLTRAGIDWNRTHLVEGWFEDTLNEKTTTKYGIRKASIIMVDCDIYSAAKSSLIYSIPFIVDYAVIFFDDWDDDITFGEFRAYSEFLAEQKHLQSLEIGTYSPNGKIFLVKNAKQTT